MGSLPRVDARNEPLAVPKRRWWTRLSSAHILIFSAGALAFVANLAVLRPSELPPQVAVAVIDLLPGTEFDPDRHVEFVSMATEARLLASLVTESSAHLLRGNVVTARIGAGRLVTHDSLTVSRNRDGLRLMSLPIDAARAAGGVLEAGDLVDVIAVENGVARYVLVSVPVVALPAERSGSFAPSSGYHLVLAVDADAALMLSVALQVADIQVIRSTGSPAPGVLIHRWEAEDVR